MVVIKIDTKTDSKEDIRKAINFLEKFLETPVREAEVEQGSFNLFDQPAQEEPEEKEDKDEDFEIKPMFY